MALIFTVAAENIKLFHHPGAFNLAALKVIYQAGK